MKGLKCVNVTRKKMCSFKPSDGQIKLPSELTHFYHI